MAPVAYCFCAMVLIALPAFITTPLSRLKISPWIGSVSALTVAPGTLSFPSSTPTTNVTVNGTATWTINLGFSLLSSWTLGVSAAAPTCTNAPLSAITVHCLSINDSGIGLVVHNCGSSVTMSTLPQTVASGVDALLIVNGTRSVSIQYSFSDLWKYTASTIPCTFNLSYVLNSM